MDAPLLIMSAQSVYHTGLGFSVHPVKTLCTYEIVTLAGSDSNCQRTLSSDEGRKMYMYIYLAHWHQRNARLLLFTVCKARTLRTFAIVALASSDSNCQQTPDVPLDEGRQSYSDVHAASSEVWCCRHKCMYSTRSSVTFPIHTIDTRHVSTSTYVHENMTQE